MMIFLIDISYELNNGLGRTPQMGTDLSLSILEIFI